MEYVLILLNPQFCSLIGESLIYAFYDYLLNDLVGLLFISSTQIQYHILNIRIHCQVFLYNVAIIVLYPNCRVFLSNIVFYVQFMNFLPLLMSNLYLFALEMKWELLIIYVLFLKDRIESI